MCKVKFKLVISLLILVFNFSVCTIPLNAQRQIDLTVDTILTPDTVFEKVQPIVTYVIRNLGPDSIYTTDTMVYYLEFAPPWGISSIFPRFNRDGIDWYKMPFIKNLGPGDTAILTWQCPSTFKLPYTMIGQILVVCYFNTGIIDTALNEKNTLNNSAIRYDIVYFFPISGIHSIAFNKTSPYPNPIEADGLLHLDNNDGSILNISIHNAVGKRINYSSATIDGLITIDTDALGMLPGVYFISIDEVDKTKTIKIIK